MMNDKTQRRLMIGVSTFILVSIIGIAYAAFTSNLNINGSGVSRKSNYDIYFNNVSNFLTTGTASVTQSTPTNQNHTTVIEDYEATLISPGDSIYFTFDIVNDGDYDATLSALTLGPVKCSVNGDETDPSATKVCNNITYTMKYTSDNSNVSVNDTLASKETKNVQVTLTYSSNISSSDLPSSNVSISNLGIDMIYGADQTAKTNSDGTTPYNPYPVGKKITLEQEDYYVISSDVDGDYITVLKSLALTVDEVNQYGGVGTENNHVNKYTAYSVGEAYNARGYGGMAYYSSATCGYATPSNSRDTSGCTSENATNYDISDIKYVVDARATAKFTNNQLKTVNGYKARLLLYDEIQPIGWPNCTSVYCDKDEFTPDWVYQYGSQETYWVMSNSNVFGDSVWHIGTGGVIDKYGVYHFYAVVRPVINVYKSVL